jgi:hypothetical protein
MADIIITFLGFLRIIFGFLLILFIPGCAIWFSFILISIIAFTCNHLYDALETGHKLCHDFRTKLWHASLIFRITRKNNRLVSIFFSL